MKNEIDSQHCIDDCNRCTQSCLEAIQHCCSKGGSSMSSQLMDLLLSCAESSQTAAHCLSRSSSMSPRFCEVCSEICNACADACEKMRGDDKMKRCADACRRCAASCESMAHAPGGA